MAYGKSQHRAMLLQLQGAPLNMTTAILPRPNRPEDIVIRADAVGAAFTVTLPDAATAIMGVIYTVTRENGAANAVTVASPGGTSDFANQALAAQYAVWAGYSDGERWHQLAP